MDFGVRTLIERARGDYPVIIAGPEEHALVAVHEFGLGRAEIVAADTDEAVAAETVERARHAGALILKGSISTPALARALLRSGDRSSRFVHVALLAFPALGRLVVLADAGINLQPTGDVQVEVAERALEVAHALGLTGGVCVLGHAEHPDKRIASSKRGVDWAERLTRRFDGEDIAVAGPLSLDLALSDRSRQKKGSALPRFDVVLAPDIVVANVLFKAVMLSGGAAAGVLASKEAAVAVPSRAGTPTEKAISLALARLLADVRGGFAVYPSDRSVDCAPEVPYATGRGQ